MNVRQRVIWFCLMTLLLLVVSLSVMNGAAQQTDATPTSRSQVIDQPIYSQTPTSLSAVEDEIAVSLTLTSRSLVTDEPIVTATPTSQSAVQNAPIATQTTTQAIDMTQDVSSNTVDVTPIAAGWIDYETSSLNAQGESVSYTRMLLIVLTTLGTVVYLYVMFLLLLTILRRRDEADIQDDAPDGLMRFVLGNSLILSPIILGVVFALLLYVMLNIRPANSSPDITIEVYGERWWWEIRYPEQNFVTANELHIPVGQTVELTLLSDNVIHSFWVPELSFKVDLIPGRENTLILEATQTGVYRGRCAEYCGLQHANMHFLIIVQSQADYEAWLNQQRQPAIEPNTDTAARGQDIFAQSGCSACHTIRGTSAQGRRGPDLTHLASRRTLAAGLLPNTRGHLAGWLVGSQDIKPGSLMPEQTIASDDLQDLLTYLQSLK